jgi:hypothetical protein
MLLLDVEGRVPGMQDTRSRINVLRRIDVQRMVDASAVSTT